MTTRPNYRLLVKRERKVSKMQDHDAIEILSKRNALLEKFVKALVEGLAAQDGVTPAEYKAYILAMAEGKEAVDADTAIVKDLAEVLK